MNVAVQVYAGPTGPSALSIDVPEGVVAAEELAAAEAKGGFNAAAVPLTALSGNGNRPHIAEAADEILAHNQVPNQGPHTPNYLADKVCALRGWTMHVAACHLFVSSCGWRLTVGIARYPDVILMFQTILNFCTGIAGTAGEIGYVGMQTCVRYTGAAADPKTKPARGLSS